MAAPIKTRKRTVDLSAPAVRGSRIRRLPPPPPAKTLSAHEIREREKKVAAIGIIGTALAVVVVTVALGDQWGWTPAQYHWRFVGD